MGCSKEVSKQSLTKQKGHQKKDNKENLVRDRRGMRLKICKLTEEIALNHAEWRERIHVVISMYLGHKVLMMMMMLMIYLYIYIIDCFCIFFSTWLLCFLLACPMCFSAICLVLVMLNFPCF